MASETLYGFSFGLSFSIASTVSMDTSLFARRTYPESYPSKTGMSPDTAVHGGKWKSQKCQIHGHKCAWRAKVVHETSYCTIFPVSTFVATRICTHIIARRVRHL